MNSLKSAVLNESRTWDKEDRRLTTALLHNDLVNGIFDWYVTLAKVLA